MSALLPAALAAGAAAVATGAPSAGSARLRAVCAGDAGPRPRPGPPGPGPGRPGAWAAGRRARAAPLALAAGGLLLGGPGLAALLAVVALLAPRALAARSRSRERRDERGAVVEACAALAAELRAGRTPAEALSVAASVAAGPASAALNAAATTAGWGGDVPAALRSGAAGSAVPEVLGALAACWQVCSAAGSGLAAAVDTVADGVRARAAQERALGAVLAGPRASAGLLALLPLAGTALAAGLGARPVHVLLHTPLGLGCLVLGAGLDLLGLLWTRALVTRAAAAA